MVWIPMYGTQVKNLWFWVLGLEYNLYWIIFFLVFGFLWIIRIFKLILFANFISGTMSKMLILPLTTIQHTHTHTQFIWEWNTVSPISIVLTITLLLLVPSDLINHLCFQECQESLWESWKKKNPHYFILRCFQCPK